MAETINWTLEVQIGGGPKKGASQMLNVEACDKLEFTVPGGDNANPGAFTAAVQPGGAGKVKFLLITSSLYDAKLTYKVDGGADIALDSSQVFLGGGNIKLLAATQKQFVFSNKVGLNSPAAVSIWVGRDAAP
jgi:hypothetical protein